MRKTSNTISPNMLSSSSYHYYIRDHQGRSAPCDASRLKNNRVVVAPDGTVEQTNDYYAYGGPWGNTSTNQGFQPFKYNGKELDRVLGLDYVVNNNVTQNSSAILH